MHSGLLLLLLAIGIEGYYIVDVYSGPKNLRVSRSTTDGDDHTVRELAGTINEQTIKIQPKIEADEKIKIQPKIVAEATSIEHQAGLNIKTNTENENRDFKSKVDISSKDSSDKYNNKKPETYSKNIPKIDYESRHGNDMKAPYGRNNHEYNQRHMNNIDAPTYNRNSAEESFFKKSFLKYDNNYNNVYLPIKHDSKYDDDDHEEIYNPVNKFIKSHKYDDDNYKHKNKHYTSIPSKPTKYDHDIKNAQLFREQLVEENQYDNRKHMRSWWGPGRWNPWVNRHPPINLYSETDEDDNLYGLKPKNKYASRQYMGEHVAPNGRRVGQYKSPIPYDMYY